MVEALKHVAIADLLRGGVAQSGVVELEVVMSGLYLQGLRTMQGHVDVVGCKADERDRGWHGIDGEVGGIRCNKSLGSCKPEPSIARAPRGRMAVGCHFASTQAVGLTEFHPVGTTSGHVAVAARNAICGCEPQMAEIIIQDCVNGCAAEACSRHRRKVLPVPEIPSVTLCADKQSSVPAL